MIFLSAQPDDFYFLWQLELQLFNFVSHKIAVENIHVLIGYDPEKGLLAEFEDFINNHKDINVHAYPDTRKKKGYASSIRPHIIAKHLQTYPELQQECIFYHDSDILLKGLPDFELIAKDNVWYAADTRSYLNYGCILKGAGVFVFEEMCRIVGIDPALVKDNDHHAGGAQYLLKNTSIEFWEKVEANCEKMYDYLIHRDAEACFCEQENKSKLFQPWCTDMWVLWWNALLSNRSFIIHTGFNFAWANSPANKLTTNKILHYSGNIKKDDHRFFRKLNYINYAPLLTDLDEITVSSCSIYFKQQLQSYEESKKSNRINLLDISFLIPARIDSEDRLENLYAVTRNLLRNFNTHIILTEIDATSKIDVAKLPDGVEYNFVNDRQPKLHRTKYNNQLIRQAVTPYIALYDVDVILPVSQILKAVTILRENKFTAVSPYNGNFIHVDRLMKAIFIKVQDVRFLEENRNKLYKVTQRSYGGAIFINKENYQKAGFENEQLTYWGPDDIERVKRLSVLGYKITRIPGDLYHLAHQRNQNSGYQSRRERVRLMEEYLKVCNMEKDELNQYTDTWPWKN
jgi:hypothetical protein